MINSLKDTWEGVDLELIKDYPCELLYELHLETKNYVLLYVLRLCLVKSNRTLDSYL
jgi:hypothetical protein